MPDKPAYVLDSYAVISYLRDESGADQVAEILERARSEEAQVYMHSVNLGEVYYVVLREEGEERAALVYAKVKRYPVEFIDDLSEDLLLGAARIKAEYAVSYADAFAVATAISKRGTLVSGDPELKPIEDAGLISIQWIG